MSREEKELCDKERRLFQVAENGSASELAELLAEGVDVNVVGEHSGTPLHWAVHFQNYDVAKMLLERGADVEAIAGGGYTALCYAAANGHIGLAQMLIDHNADVNIGRLSPLGVAAATGNADMVRFLLSCNASIEMSAGAWSPLLHSAVACGHISVVEILIDNGADVNATDDRGDTALHITAQTTEERPEIAKYLLEHGADHNIANQSGETAWYTALSLGHTEIARALLAPGAEPQGDRLFQVAAYGSASDLEELLSEGVDVNAECEDWGNPLRFAIRHRNYDVAKMLLENGAIPDTANTNGYTTLHLAVDKGDSQLVTLLLDHGANPNAKSHSGTTPIMAAAKGGRPDVVQLLLQQESSPLSPLSIAVKIGNMRLAKLIASRVDSKELHRLERTAPFNADVLELCRLLIEKGADVNTRDAMERTMLFDMFNVELCRLLIDNGADVNARDRSERTPLWEAVHRGHTDVVRLLLSHGAVPDDTMWRVTAEENYVEIAQMLIEHGLGVEGGVESDEWGRMNGRTPLEVALAHESYETAELLIARGADPERSLRYVLDLTIGRNARFVQRAKIVKWLLEAGAGIWRDYLCLAARYCDVETVNLLIERGADLDYQDNWSTNLSPLHEAARFGKTEVVKLLLERGADVHRSARGELFGKTALYLAAEGGHKEIVSLLLDAGATMTLEIATVIGDAEKSSQLLAEGANPNGDYGDGPSPTHLAPLHIAVQNNDDALTKMLLDHDAKTDLCDRAGRTPLDLAVGQSNTQLVELLLQHGADPNWVPFWDHSAGTALHKAAEENNPDVVKTLLDHKANILAKGYKGRTPLHYAASANAVEAAKVLIGRMLSEQDDDGKTPLHEAVDRGNVEMIELLLACGADATVKDKSGRVPQISTNESSTS